MTARRIGYRLAIVAAVAGLGGLAAGCAGVVVGTGATGATMAAQERSFGQGIDDAETRVNINGLWFHHSEEMYNRVSLSISEGRVMLTGQVKSEQMMLDAVRLTWQAKGVTEVINEIQVGEDRSVETVFRDNWITTQLKTGLAFDDKVHSINYSIDTVSGVVYVFGLAQDQDERTHVVKRAKAVEYVQNVVNHVWLKSDPRRKANQKPEETDTETDKDANEGKEKTS